VQVFCQCVSATAAAAACACEQCWCQLHARVLHRSRCGHFMPGKSQDLSSMLCYRPYLQRQLLSLTGMVHVQSGGLFPVLIQYQIHHCPSSKHFHSEYDPVLDVCITALHLATLLPPRQTSAFAALTPQHQKLRPAWTAIRACPLDTMYVHCIWLLPQQHIMAYTYTISQCTFSKSITQQDRAATADQTQHCSDSL